MSLPRPEPGLVINYAYLWRREHEAGAVEGRKSRPCVIVLRVETSFDGSFVTVIPITHAPPRDVQTAIEVPAAVGRHLGWDDRPSWIMVDEANRFLWPGYDLVRREPSNTVEFNFLPPRLFERVIQAFQRFHKGAGSIVDRS